VIYGELNASPEKTGIAEYSDADNFDEEITTINPVRITCAEIDKYFIFFLCIIYAPLISLIPDML
jgi:hypothetical protein